MSEFVKRTLSGIIFVGCIVTCVLSHFWALGGLILVVCLLAVDEFHRLTGSPRSLRIYAALSTSLLWSVAAFHTYPWMPALGLAYIALLIVCMLDEIWNLSGKPLQNWGNMLISQIMIAMPLCTMLLLESLDKWLLLALFVLIWVNDTGAYCIGTLTAKRPQGNHKMTPHISPKKSWEGLIGGIVFCLLVAYVLAQCGWFDAISAHEHDILVALIFAALTSLFGTMGDLMESLFKRSIGVKDSGHFMPGHGGILDRFDSLLLASPILTAFCWLCYFIAPLL